MVFVIFFILFAYNCGALNLKPPKSTTSAASSAEKSRALLQVMLNQQTEVQSDFTAYKRKLMDLCAPISSSATSSLQSLLASPEPIRLVHFSSVHDEVEKNGENTNTNVNDKIWRAALRFGRVDKGIGSLPISLEKVGPFTVLQTRPDFVITLTFSNFFSLRYLYNFENSSSAIRYSEFQCILFGKLVYNRIIDRKENWDCFYVQESQQEGESLAIVAIRNIDLTYERIATFRR